MAEYNLGPKFLPAQGESYPEPTDDELQIIQVLTGYKSESDNNRRGGLNPRDDKWKQNLNLYWNRYDFRTKASWQAKEVMPEVPSFVDRFAAALKEALVTTPQGFYTVTDPYDKEGDLSSALKRMTDVWLGTAGRNQTGAVLGFPAVFEEQMKLGSLMACCATVLWRKDVPGGRVSIESVDPRQVWLDHTYRNLYRMRQVELDVTDLMDMARAKDEDGYPIFNVEAIDRCLAGANEEAKTNREELTGSGAETPSSRRTITLDEYIATVVARDGRVLARDELMVVANGRYLVRGPEKNPYWHGRDWMVFTPLVTAPLSVYGRSYMEDFGDIAKTFTELTNLILDAAQTSAIKAFVMVPSMLTNPEQALSGIWPNKTFLLEEGFDAKSFAAELSLGSLDAGVVQIWQSLKNELHEAAGINEVGLGQFAPRGRTSATEVGAALNNSGAIVKAVAQTVETRFLDPVLDLVWKTGLQHADPEDQRMKAAVGEELWATIMDKRREMISRPVTFKAQGISAMIQKAQLLQSLLQLLQIVAQNQNLLAAFMQEVDLKRLIDLLFDLSNIDPTKLQASEREKLIQEAVSPLVAGAQGGTPTAAGAANVRPVAKALGIAKGGGGY